MMADEAMAASKTLIQLAKRFIETDFFDLVYDDDSRQDNITNDLKTMIKSFYTRNWLRKQGLVVTDDIAAQLQQEGISMDPAASQMELFDKRTEFFEKLADYLAAFINGMKVTLPPPDTSAYINANGNGMTTDQITKKVSEVNGMLASPSLQSAMIKIIAEVTQQVVKKQEILSKPLTRYVLVMTPENIEFASQIFSKSLLKDFDEGLLRRTCHIAGVDPDYYGSTKVSVSDTTPDYKYPDNDTWAMTTNAGIAFNVIGNDQLKTDIMNSYNRRQPMWGDMHMQYDIELAPDDMNGQKTIDTVRMALLFATMNSAVLNSARTDFDEDGIGVSITERSFVISLAKRHTQVIYIPAENLCYFAGAEISMTVTETFSRIMLARHARYGEIAEDQLTKALGEALGANLGMGNTTRITPDIANRLTDANFMNYLNNDGMVDSTINRYLAIVDEMGNFINSRSTLYGLPAESTLPLVIGDDVRNPIGGEVPKMSFSDANKIEYTERLLINIGDLNEAYQKTPEQKLYASEYNADQFTDSEQEKAKLGTGLFGQLEQYAYEQPSTPTGNPRITLLPEAYRRVAQENARPNSPFKADGMLASLDIVITDARGADKPTKPQTIKLNFAAALGKIGGENKPKVGVESILGRVATESLRRSQSDFFERQLGISPVLLISDTGFDELFGLKPSRQLPNKLYQWIYDALKSKGAIPIDLRQQLLEPVREFHDHTSLLSTKDLINTTLIYDNVADAERIFDALPELEVIVTIATSTPTRTELTGIASSRIRTVKNRKSTSPSAQQQRGKREDGGVETPMEDISKLTGDPAVAAILQSGISLTG
ncbi:hypothetical protein SPFM8_00204 [Salmonella phage SPFM8]|nr:hypothetical protein SPFM8_00204 [Salmonella phage SPFM8]